MHLILVYRIRGDLILGSLILRYLFLGHNSDLKLMCQLFCFEIFDVCNYKDCVGGGGGGGGGGEETRSWELC